MTTQPDSQSTPPRSDFGEGNTVQGPVAGGNQENYDLQGAQGPVIKPQGPVTQTWYQSFYLNVPPSLRVLAVVVAVVLVVALIAIVVTSRQQAKGVSGIAARLDATPTPTVTSTITPTPLPTLTPTPTPTPIRMTGVFNVLVAEFGEPDSQGTIQASEPGYWLSRWLAGRLDQEFASTNLGIEVWHDQLNKPASNPMIGIVVDDAQAQAQIEKFGADMLIYGTLDNAQDPAALQLNFAWRAPALQNEPDAVIGHQKLGQSVPIANVRQGLYKEAVDSDPTLLRRVNTLIWLSKGLAKDIIGAHAEARDIFLDAEQKIVDWPDSDGKQVLYYFQGREYLALHQLKEAEEKFAKAIALDPGYVNARIGLGNVFFDKASFYFISQQPLNGDLNTCDGAIGSDQLAAIADQIPITISEALTATQQAIDSYQLALDKAPGSTWQPLETVAQYMLGRGYRLKGDAARLVSADYWPQASDDLIKAEALISPTLQQFSQDQLNGFLAYGYFDLASAQRAKGAIYEGQARSASDAQQAQASTDQAIAAYNSALENYQLCSAQKSLLDGDGSNGMQTKIACFCEGYEIVVGKRIGDLGGASG